MGSPPEPNTETVPGTALAAADATGQPLPRDEFKPGLPFYGAFGSLLIVNLAAALDATSLSVALPVGFFLVFLLRGRHDSR